MVKIFIIKCFGYCGYSTPRINFEFTFDTIDEQSSVIRSITFAAHLNTGEEYRNRKGIFSNNVQGVCNADLILMNVVARWPGSSHDATVFNNSVLKMQCEEGLFGNRWLIGDSAYYTYIAYIALLNPTSPPEHRYNEAHIKTRNTIER
ncbi:unnamed protein product [Euphydryas editha]|uniref:DDE Tnp4 domain-containing protein n=2 Tax=Euphydryas editha TaxID=104508 RepID=A0AAU9USM4_EUPED|nr:unnamed protein product [Euphydryas editha]